MPCRVRNYTAASSSRYVTPVQCCMQWVYIHSPLTVTHHPPLFSDPQLAQSTLYEFPFEIHGKGVHLQDKQMFGMHGLIRSVNIVHDGDT